MEGSINFENISIDNFDFLDENQEIQDDIFGLSNGYSQSLLENRLFQDNNQLFEEDKSISSVVKPIDNSQKMDENIKNTETKQDLVSKCLDEFEEIESFYESAKEVFSGINESFNTTVSQGEIETNIADFDVETFEDDDMIEEVLDASNSGSEKADRSGNIQKFISLGNQQFQPLVSPNLTEIVQSVEEEVIIKQIPDFEVSKQVASPVELPSRFEILSHEVRPFVRIPNFQNIPSFSQNYENAVGNFECRTCRTCYTAKSSLVRHFKSTKHLRMEAKVNRSNARAETYQITRNIEAVEDVLSSSQNCKEFIESFNVDLEHEINHNNLGVPQISQNIPETVEQQANADLVMVQTGDFSFQIDINSIQNTSAEFNPSNSFTPQIIQQRPAVPKQNIIRHQTEQGVNFPCQFCAKTFTTSSNLRRHEHLHGTTKQHQCPICDKRFMQNEYLKKHLATHRGFKSVAFAHY